jgi:hypothetical protein
LRSKAEEETFDEISGLRLLLAAEMQRVAAGNASALQGGQDQMK